MRYALCNGQSLPRLRLNYQASEGFHVLSRFATPEILRFIQDAYKSSPYLFSDKISSDDIAKLYAEITIVFSAWRRLRRMRKSKEKWSEADFTANVFVRCYILLLI
jgi:solute carrier family 25 carnitine/acylcarnitine transporter 20/29